MIVTRFAPSPNGLLHLGHAYSAIVAHDLARKAEVRFLLRIEDIDGERSRPELADEFRRDLEWLGLEWDEVPAQSTRFDSYREAADRLADMDLLYPCQCTRTEIAKHAVEAGPEGLIYPGTCKCADIDLDQPVGWRLDMQGAIERVGTLAWEDAIAGEQSADPAVFGDVMLVRKYLPSSYHLAVTLDDAADGVTLVTRGADLFQATHVHRLLQALLDLPVPRWHHHPVLLDESGKKLAKRRGSSSLSDLRKAGEDGRLLAEQLRLQRLPAGISLEKA